MRFHGFPPRILSSPHRLNKNTGGFAAAEAQAVITQANFHRVAQRRKADDLDCFPFDQAHFQQALHQRTVSLDAHDLGVLPDVQLIQGWHDNWSRRQEVLETGQPACRTGRTRICLLRSLRRLSRQPPTCNRHGRPVRTTCKRLPARMPSSAMRLTQPGSPVTSATSAHSPELNNSTGITTSECTMPGPQPSWAGWHCY